MKALTGALLLVLTLGCGGGEKGSAAVLEVEGFGEIRLEFLRDAAPKTVDHFITLARKGTFDGTRFHRVVPGFMIQGGTPRAGRNVEDEFGATPHVRGTVSLANRGYPNSGAAEFFIVVADAPALDGKYAAFARVTAGLDVADQIAAVERDPRDRPLQDVVITRVRIEP